MYPTTRDARARLERRSKSLSKIRSDIGESKFYEQFELFWKQNYSSFQFSLSHKMSSGFSSSYDVVPNDSPPSIVALKKVLMAWSQSLEPDLVEAGALWWHHPDYLNS